METELSYTDAQGTWSTTGVAVTMASVDNANGNKFAVTNNTVIIVRNSDVTSHNVTFTSQPDAETGRSGDIDVSLAAGEIRYFRFSKRGWADATGFAFMPSGQSSTLKVGVVRIV